MPFAAVNLSPADNDVAATNVMKITLTVSSVNSDLQAVAEDHQGEAEAHLAQINTPPIRPTPPDGPVTAITGASEGLASVLQHINAFMKLAGLVSEVCYVLFHVFIY